MFFTIIESEFGLFKMQVKSSGEKGTGLGLIICKEFVLKNNGLIWIKRTFGVGTSVFLSLPKSFNKEMTDIKK